MKPKETKIVTAWQCEYCNEVFDNEYLCELHERTFCEMNPELKEYVKSKINKWYMDSKGEIRKIAGYDYEFGDFVAPCYLNTMEFVVYPKKDLNGRLLTTCEWVDGLLTTREWVDAAMEISDDQAYSLMKDKLLDMIEGSMKNLTYVRVKRW